MQKIEQQISPATQHAIDTLLRSEGSSWAQFAKQREPVIAEEFLTINETAELLNVSPDTVRRRIKSGVIKAKKLNSAKNGSVRVLKSSILAWLSECNLENIKEKS